MGVTCENCHFNECERRGEFSSESNNLFNKNRKVNTCVDVLKAQIKNDKDIKVKFKFLQLYIKSWLAKQKELKNTKMNTINTSTKEFSKSYSENFDLRSSSLKTSYNKPNLKSFQMNPLDNKFNNNSLLKNLDELKEEAGIDITLNTKDGKSFVNNYKFDNNSLYTGEILNGLQHGKGTKIMKDGGKYEGEWKNGKFDGFGIFYYSNGNIYKGNFKNGEANGHGVFKSKTGAEYDGEWADSMQNGFGKEKWSDGSEYRGNYYKGKKEGYGEFKWEGNNKYLGNWSEDKQNGYGKFEFDDGRTFEGYIKDNFFEGKGLYTWKNGNQYLGYFVKGKKEGLGRYIWSDGNMYIGYWKEGNQDGLAKLYNKNKEYKYGIWNKGERDRFLENKEVKKLLENNDEFYRNIEKFMGEIINQAEFLKNNE